MRPMRDYLLPLSNLQGYLGYRGIVSVRVWVKVWGPARKPVPSWDPLPFLLRQSGHTMAHTHDEEHSMCNHNHNNDFPVHAIGPEKKCKKEENSTYNVKTSTGREDDKKDDIEVEGQGLMPFEGE
ncbi:hypothetical protein BU15DRAFT_68341 [Melanogaster broomeanus]|nr:hypothetical protein BU15DRAFT_68341 [Melanogaster broomeanus]